MASPSQVVSEAFANASDYATRAQSDLTEFTAALNTAAEAAVAPAIDATWVGLPPPALPPDLEPLGPQLPVIEYDPPDVPIGFSLAEPTIEIADFTEEAPTLSMPTAPVVDYGTAPSIPEIGAVALPTAPTLVAVDAPTYLTLATPTFEGIDLHTDYLAKLDDIPTLELVAPTPYSYSLGPEYASQLLTNLKATLNARLAGGTGLASAVEQAIWDRARDRETQLALGNEADVMRSSEALGFQLPPGVVAAQIRTAQKDYYTKLSGLSRDIAIKQADLEQENLKQTIAAGMDLEGKLIDYSYRLEQLTFESAKAAATNAMETHNAQVEHFKALLSAYNTYASAYDAIIKAELGKVEVYKAELAGEQAKADVNTALVQQYKAAIEAGMSQVEIYKAEVGAANTLVQLEQTKISAAGEQIKAYVAAVNAETSKIEAYKAGVHAESTKVDIYKTKAEVFGIKTNAQAEKARAEISRYAALSQSKAAEWDGYKSRVNAEGERMRALAAKSNALAEGYKADASTLAAKANMTAQIWETQIKEYEASQSVALQSAKVNGDFLIATNNARLDAAKVGAQVYAQLTSSAYGMIKANANVSADVKESVAYTYSNETVDKPPAVRNYS